MSTRTEDSHSPCGNIHCRTRVFLRIHGDWPRLVVSAPTLYPHFRQSRRFDTLVEYTFDHGTTVSLAVGGKRIYNSKEEDSVFTLEYSLAMFRFVLSGLFLVLVTSPLPADEPSPAAPLMKLLQSGRLPVERVGTVVEMVCQKGNGQDLAYVFGQLQKPDAFQPSVRLKVLELLTDAALVRKVKPAGDLTALKTLLADATEPKLKLAALKLASVWKLQEIAPEVQSLAVSDKSDPAIRAAAIDGLASMGDAASKAALVNIAGKDRAVSTRMQAVASLARVDVDEACRQAALVLAAATPKDDPALLIDAILSRQGGAEKLAAALNGVKLPKEVAKVTLRYMYSIGRSDEGLSNLLSKAAEIALDAPPPSQAEVLKIAVEVMAKGNAARGEKVFRRADVNCFKCHSLARAGGQVGPELTALGSISPPEYIVNSILNPTLNIKEQFVTKVVLTADGEVVTGIVIDRNDERVRLKDANSKVITLASGDIESEKDGPSLMPQGLTKFLTHEEFLDLSRFITELGRPGPYAIRTVPTLQRWRLLKSPAAEISGEVPNVEHFRQHVLELSADAWLPLYGTVRGPLPLADVLSASGAGKPAAILQGEVEVSQAGELQLEVHSPVPTHFWLDAEPFEKPEKLTLLLSAGRHKLTLRLDLSSELPPDASLHIELKKPAGSSIQFDVVGGQ
jgi:putative heme-binding domain-containing protein